MRVSEKLSKLEDARRERNAAIVEKVKSGAPIAPAVSTQALFFPPRPIIKKDAKEMARLYGTDEEDRCKKVLIEL